MKQLENYEKACNELMIAFLDKYFEEHDFYWIGKEVGGVAEIDRYYFLDMPMILNTLRLKCPKEKFHEWYDYQANIHFENMDQDKEDPVMGLKEYLKQ